ncbi:3-methyl-2-oxobutanoate hydroxymethyltransferase [Celerinatantimonas sp. MCCC 1A17872]|uniref:3-methyl-2-oxobutanoate hydroxymethyltransferase n=1 Tax=Celerinatantimonas sp. MCCC 1A17872 TaxID=3177514 RepID=UPI0038CBF6B4
MVAITTTKLAAMKAAGEKIATLTAYDSSFAHLFDNSGIDALLIGDSLGMVIQGQSSTLPVSVEDIAYHTKAVAQGCKNALILADMPFMSMPSLETTLLNAATLMRAGANMVKIEGGQWLCETIQALVQRAVPVCVHMGLTPQSVHLFGGYKVQGRSAEQAADFIAQAKAVENAGAQLLVVECVPASLGKALSEALTIPVIGIGAGVDTDGQILVMHDLLGITPGKLPKFAKNYMEQANSIPDAVCQYIQEVRQGIFPSQDHIFNE